MLLLRFSLDLIQQFLEQEIFFDRSVIFEYQFRNPAQVMQPLRQRAFYKMRRRPQSLQGFLTLVDTAQNSNEHAGMTEIRGDLHPCCRHKMNSRILNLALENFAD